MNDKSRELWDIQMDFTKKFWATKGGMPDIADEKAMTAITKDYALHLIAEVTEVVQELSFRMHRASKGAIDRDNLAEELIDCNKFLLGMFQIWGFTYEQYVEEFKRKSMVVEQRFAQERSLPALANATCVIIDIDGVLADYPNGFYEYCVKTFYPKFSKQEFAKFYKEVPILNREAMKASYRQSGIKANLGVIPGSKELLDSIRRRSNGNIKVILMTKRPYSRYYRIYPDTLEWLAKNELVYDGIIWAEDKGIETLQKFKNVMWSADDELSNVKRFKEAGITAIHVDNSDPRTSTLELFKMVETAHKIEDVGYAWTRRAEVAA